MIQKIIDKIAQERKKLIDEDDTIGGTNHFLTTDEFQLACIDIIKKWGDIEIDWVERRKKTKVRLSISFFC